MLAVHLVVSDEIAFSDAPSYLYYVDNLYFFRTSDWFIFEPFSKSWLLALRELTGNTERTVVDAHYVISATYLLGTLVVFPPSRGNWRGLLMAFALFGPQLAFVTIRATPAYIFAAVAALCALNGKNRAFVFGGLAAMFHISSALALPPIGALFSRASFKWLAIFQRPKMLLFSFIVVAGGLTLLGSTILSLVTDLFNAIPFLGKYLVFAVSASDDTGAGNLSGFAIGHYVLLASVTGFTMVFLLQKDSEVRAAGIFVIVSYLTYVFIFTLFSPIAAFRQTPFWMLPAFSIFPWQRLGWRGIGGLGFLALASGIFLFQFSRVIAL